jgi:hypothetical protein
MISPDTSLQPAADLETGMFEAQLRNAPRLGDIVLGEGRVAVAVPLESWRPRSEQEQRDVLMALGSLSADTIRRSFAPTDTDVDAFIPPQSQPLRAFNTTLVQEVTGKEKQAAAEVLTDQASMISTLMNGLATSEVYLRRRTYLENPRLEDGTSGMVVGFAAMRHLKTGEPEMVAHLSRTMVGKGTERRSEQHIHIETTLKGTLENGSLVLSQQGDQSPDLFYKTYYRGESQLKPIVDAAGRSDEEKKQKYIEKTMAAITMAAMNHEAADDRLAKAAARRGYIF